MREMVSRSVDAEAGIRGRLLAVLGACLLVIASAGLVSAHSESWFGLRASVQPRNQYLNDTTGTLLTFTVHNTSDVGIGAVEISRPWNAWKVLACPTAPAGWATQQTDKRCRYQSAPTPADDIAPHTTSSAFGLTAGTAPGTKDVVGRWSVAVSRTSNLDDHGWRRWADDEGTGLWTRIRTFEILDAVVVGSAPTPGSACPAPTPANHAAHAGATSQRIAICGRNRATVALAPIGLHASLGGSFIAKHGSFSSGPIAPSTTGSVVLGTWSGVTITPTSGGSKAIVARIGAAWYRTSPVTTLAGYSTKPAGPADPPGPTDDAPVVTSTSPFDGATQVAASANIVIHFSEPVSVSSGSFSLACPAATPRAFTVSGSGTSSIVLGPTADLPEGVVCTVTTHAAAISDTDTLDPPDHPTADRAISFTTQAAPVPVDAAPAMTTTTPAEGSSDVDPGANIVVHFSEAVDVTTDSFTIGCPGAQTFTVSGSGTSTITLDPAGALPMAATCTVTAVAAHISDSDTVDPPDHPAANAHVSFDVSSPSNHAPTDIALAPTSVNENEPSGTPVGTLTTTDPDPSDTFSYALVGGAGSADNGSFQIAGDQVLTGATFDVESKSTYSIRVRSTDSGSMSIERAFTITVKDVNEPPTGPTLAGDTVPENSPKATLIGVLSTTDPDVGQSFAYTLRTSGCGGAYPDSGAFQVSGANLQVDAALDFEAKAAYTICVRVTDDGSPDLFHDAVFTISVTNVNDAPVANPDTYTGAVGNTLAVLGTTGTDPQVVLTGSLLAANDTDEDMPPDTLTVVPETVTSAGGGTATINADGSFTFLPGVGDKNMDDTFTYHVSDGMATTAGTAKVHIGSLVWYVYDQATGVHDGRSTSPFVDLSTLDGVGGSGDSDGPGDVIFIYQGGDSYGGGLPLEPNQQLLGSRAGLSVDGHDLLSPASDGPVIANASGVGVTLANGVDVEGLDIAGTSGDGIFGSSITKATVAVTSPVDVSGAGGDGIELSGAASGDIGIGATVFESHGHSVIVTGRSGGTVSMSGLVIESGTGILVDSNAGATVNFTGGIAASTGTHAAFTATGGGTVNVTTSDNTLATTTGIALHIDGTTIGSDGVTFAWITSDGAPSGIVLNGTGSVGGLTVSGTGGPCTTADPTCSGGTIRNSTGDGIVLHGAMDPSFTSVRVVGSAANGIGATDVRGLDVIDSLIDLNGASGIAMSGIGTQSSTLGVAGSAFTDNATGIGIGVTGDADTTFDLHGNTFLRSKASAIQVLAGASSTANAHLVGSITGNVIGDATADSGARDLTGIAIEIDDDADAVIEVTGNTIQHTDQQGILVEARDPNLGDGNAATAALDIHVRDNSISSIDDNTLSPSGLVYGAVVDAGSSTNVCLDIAGNTSSSVGAATGIRVRQGDTSVHRLERFVGNGASDAAVGSFLIAQNDPGTTADATHSTGFSGVADGTCRDVP